MSKYIANPVEVDAFEIVYVNDMKPDGSIAVQLRGAGWKLATPGMVSRMTPEVGDYWVIQSDGYEYLNPKEVFERKYRSLESVFAAQGQAMQASS